VNDSVVENSAIRFVSFDWSDRILFSRVQWRIDMKEFSSDLVGLSALFRKNCYQNESLRFDSIVDIMWTTIGSQFSI